MHNEFHVVELHKHRAPQKPSCDQDGFFVSDVLTPLFCEPINSCHCLLPPQNVLHF
jgi:hypothetical protein